jgi:uncharacterized protein YjbI with pentapeptide repeats
MKALSNPRAVVFSLSIALVSLGVVLTSAPAGAAAVTVPGVPTKVKAVGVNTAVDVLWKAPLSTGGSPITGYVATAKIGKSFKTTCTTTARSCSIAGLANGTTYSIQVYATNVKGKGSTSAALKIQPSTTQNCLFFGPYANLQSCNLAGASIPVPANLSNANLTNAVLTGVNLTGANLMGANLTNANLNGAGLTGATLTNAVLTGVQSGGVTGTPAALPTNWQAVDGYLVGPGATLTNAVLNGANLTGATLTNAVLNGANLTTANLTTANLTGANLTNANLNGAGLTGATLTNAVLTGVQSGGVTGTPAALPTNWQAVDGYLVGPGANLTNAVLTGANLNNADLAGANLTGANLENANIGGANFTSAIWANTTCPDGTKSNSDGGTCANNRCLAHSDGLGQTYASCAALGTYSDATATEAATAYAVSIGLSAADVSDGWTCSADTSLVAVAISPDGVHAINYLWVYSGDEKGWVIPASDCTEKVGTWN